MVKRYRAAVLGNLSWAFLMGEQSLQHKPQYHVSLESHSYYAVQSSGSLTGYAQLHSPEESTVREEVGAYCKEPKATT